MIEVKKVVTELRRVINAPSEAVLSDPNALALVKLAVDQIFGDVPELRYVPDGQRIAPPDQFAAENDLVPVPPILLQPVVDYAAHRYFMGDSGAARDEKRAAELLASYMRVINPER